MAIALGTAPVFPCKRRDVPPFLLSWSFCLYRRTCPDLGGKEIFVGAQRQRIKKRQASRRVSCQAFTFGLPSATSSRGGRGSEGVPRTPKPAPALGERCALTPPGGCWFPAQAVPAETPSTVISYLCIVILSLLEIPESCLYKPPILLEKKKKICLTCLRDCNWLLYLQGF